MRAHTKGRGTGTPAAYREAIAKRVLAARLAAGYDTQTEIAAALSELTGLPVSQDRYRSWEWNPNGSRQRQLSPIPHEFILPFCNLTRIRPADLLALPGARESSH